MCTEPLPQFYFALGARPRPQDIQIAIAVGQRHLLVPAGSRAARLLSTIDGITVIFDSGA